MISMFEDRIALGWMVDDTFSSRRRMFLDKTLDQIEEFLWTCNLGPTRLITQPVIGHDDCWVLRYGRNKTQKTRLYVMKRARVKLGREMGLYPAALYVMIPDFYDEDFKKLYQGALRIDCKFGVRDCARPSHMILCDYWGEHIHSDIEKILDNISGAKGA